MDTDKKNTFTLSYHAKFIIILILVALGMSALYYGMQYTVKKITPQQNLAAIIHSDNKNTTVIEE